jgi:glycogen phosphorylase
MVHPIARVTVVPRLPKRLARLEELAYNLRWSWDHQTIDLFRRLSPELWESTYHNPVAMLGQVKQERLNELAKDSAFLAHYDRTLADFDLYMSGGDSWYQKQYGKRKKHPRIAYFSMEFGLTECFQNYSGGLGILSGDHLKSASDLGLPLVGVGLLYQEGYFHQYLNADGWQQESYPINDYAHLPIRRQVDGDGNPITISVPLPGRELYAHVWQVQVGRVPLYLLDTNIPANPRAEDRDLADRLYGGDRRTRIRQEILMGIGGIRALEALGLRPDVCHMNEGHSAFLLLERIRILMREHNLSFEQARIITAISMVFTIHTPVPAGLERFGFDLIDEHFTDYMREVGISRDEFLNLGRENMGDYELFSMSVMALYNSYGANGVAKLHGRVSREMWQWMFPNVPVPEIPITSVTNGVHVETWTSHEMGQLLDRYLSPSWRDDEDHATTWEKVDEIPDNELWRVHIRRKERLVSFARNRIRQQLLRRGATQSELESIAEILNPDALTIGFARRFATYKRATLIFRDIQRLKSILGRPNMPVQFIFAGKAHPHDNSGKEFIRAIVKQTEDPDLKNSVVFLEDYDMQIARYMLQGVDVWLNTPRRPKEASGTSGMKAIYNGGLNFSILDGWWDEAYSPDLGWAIGNGEQYGASEEEYQDYVESEALYKVLENDIIPIYYDRGRDGLPHAWIKRVKTSMRQLSPVFNTRRMVREYTESFYMPVYERLDSVLDKDLQTALAFSAWKTNLAQVWPQVRVLNVHVDTGECTVGTETQITAEVHLGALKPSEVVVELYAGSVDTFGSIIQGQGIPMVASNGKDNNGTYQYEATYVYQKTGQQGFSVRVMPHHPFLHTPFQPGMIVWA